MSLTLKDLRKWGSPMHGYSDEVTLSDLVEVLKQEGAVTIWWCEEHETHGGSRQFKAAHQFCKSSFDALVLPLGDTP